LVNKCGTVGTIVQTIVYLATFPYIYTLATLEQLQKAIELLESLNVTPCDLILSLLQDPWLQTLSSARNLTDHAADILSAFRDHPKSSASTMTWAMTVVKARYAKSIKELTEKENGWHFSALRATASQLQEFHIEDMAQKMEDLAPELWDLLGTMLTADRGPARMQEEDGDQIMEGIQNDERACLNEGEGDKELVADDVNIADASNPNRAQNPWTTAQRREALVTIVRS
jgi:hypothetical protein